MRSGAILTRLTTAIALLVDPATLMVHAAHAAAPSFDCSATSSHVQELICGDAQLSALDREAMRLFSLASDSKPKGKAGQALTADRDTWMAARDNCASATETRDCVTASYLKRIADLRATYPAARSADKKGISLGPDKVTCEGVAKPFTVTFANTATPVAYLALPSGPITAQLGPTGSGARYIAAAKLGGGDTVFWIKGRDATLTMADGKDHACKIARRM